VIKNRPVIIEGSVPQWKALELWTPDFFRDKFGDTTVKVTYGITMPFRELMDAIETSTPSKPAPYLHQLIIHHHMPQLLPYLTPENIYAFPRRFSSPLMPARCRRPDGYLKLLIGGVGGKFPFMHFDSDNANALITEIYGDKEFVFFAPEDTPYMYAKDDVRNVSQIDDLETVDPEIYPLFSKATPYRGVIKPGETIFVPSGWWHSARVVSTSISVCTNMLDASNWPGFVKWLCRPVQGRSPILRYGRGIYLSLIGLAIATVEGIQKALPGSAIARAIAHLAPLRQEDVRGRVLPTENVKSDY
jgi:Cupin-like domain